MNVAASGGGADVTGYVIPIRRVLRVAEAIEAGDDSGSVVVGGTAFLGVSLPARSSAPTLAGVVAGSPAATLGLVAGDTITEIDGTAIATPNGVRTAVASHEPGESVTVRWTDARGAAHQGSVTVVNGPVR